MSAGDRGEVVIRSFRVVFEHERRIHKVDRIRLPLPYGLPLRSLAYGAIVLIALLVLSRMPLLGGLVGLIPLPVRVAVLPALGAYLLTQVKPDGRPAHRFLLCWVRLRVTPRKRTSLLGGAPGVSSVRLGALTVAPDERGPAYRRGTIDGPAHALMRMPVRARKRGRDLVVEPDGHEPLYRGRQLRLAAGQRALVR